jgi:uncharacterized repeat protein (TIGR01451 family)
MKKRILNPRVAVIAACLLAAITGGYLWRAQAGLTSPVDVKIVYPLQDSGIVTIGSTADHQVFRPNAVAPEVSIASAGAIFGGLNPKTDGQAQFLTGNAGAIGQNDYVYAFRINNADPDPAKTIASLSDFRTGRCTPSITSIGYYPRNGAINPVQGFLSPGFIQFFFSDDANPNNLIPPGGKSALLFFTSPDPPARQTTSVGGGAGNQQGGGAVAQGQTPLAVINGTGNPPPSPNEPVSLIANERVPAYGPCRPEIKIDKEVACADSGPWEKTKQVTVGSNVFFRITIRNTGAVKLDNINVFDPQILAGVGEIADGQFKFCNVGQPTANVNCSGAAFAGMLLPGQSVSFVSTTRQVVPNNPVPGISVSPGDNPATTTSEYLIPDQLGNIPAVNPPSIPVAPVIANTPGVDVNEAPVAVLIPNIACQKTVTSPSFLPGTTNFNSFPITMTWSLKVNNTGQTPLTPTVIDDAKLKAIIAAPPAGITVNSVNFTNAAGFATGTFTSGNFPASVNLATAGNGNSMSQVNVTLTINNYDAFKSIADPTLPGFADRTKFTNTMTAVGSFTGGEICVGSGTGSIIQVGCESSTDVMFMPNPAIDIIKEVACGTANAPGTFNDTSVTALSGSSIVYRIKVRNTGNEPLNNVVVTDAKLPGSPFNVGSLAIGEEKTLPLVSKTLTTSDTNTASVVGTGAVTGTSVNDSDNASVNIINPSITCDKRVNDVKVLGNYTPGTGITFSLSATNSASSGTPLDITIDDATVKQFAGFVCRRADTNAVVALPFTFTNVAPGATVRINCTGSFATFDAFKAAAALDTTPGDNLRLTNTTTVSANLPSGSPICKDGANPAPPYTCSSSAEVSVRIPVGIALTKAVACGTNPAEADFSAAINALQNAPITYRFVVTNTGQDVLNNVTITDNQLKNLPAQPSGSFNASGVLSVGTLNVGESKTFRVTTTAPNSITTLTNVATASGTGVSSSDVANSTQATASVTVINPQISCLKSVNGVTDLKDYQPGAQLVWTLTANNLAGSTTLNLKLEDPALQAIPGIVFRDAATNAVVAMPFTFTNVAAGTSKTITATHTFASREEFIAAAGGVTFTNTLQVTGTVPGTATFCGTSSGTLQSTCTAKVSLAPEEQPVCIINFCNTPDCVNGDPGTRLDTDPLVSDQRPASVLVYNYYTSNSSQASVENTRFGITNTSRETVFVHLFYVDGTTCSVKDSIICLSGFQTARLLASDLDPDTTGYLVAVAIGEDGCPIRHNFLIGDAYVKTASGFAANLAAEGFAALIDNPAGCEPTQTTATIRLNGVNYSASPRALAVDSIPSRADASTLLVLNRLGGDLAGTSANSIGSLFGLLYDDVERQYSYSFSSSRCQFTTQFTNTFPSTAPRFENIVTAGRTGWTKFYSSTAAAGYLGSVLYKNNGAASLATQGHNLHKLTYTAPNNSPSYTVPVFPISGF